jgi:hypothetical protein
MNKHNIGLAAESLVQFDLQRKGIIVYTTGENKTTKDLIAETPDGMLHSIQVKSYTTDDESHDVDIRRPSAKNRHYNANDFDVLALVDMNRMTIAYISLAELTERGVKRSIRVWRSAKRDYSTKTPYKKEPLFYEDYQSFENAIGRRFETDKEDAS